MLKRAILNKLSKKTSGIGESISIDRANSVGILSIFENPDELKELRIELEQLGKTPRVMTFVTQPERGKEYDDHSFTTKDISITGTILSDELLYFTKQKYDYLICLDHQGNKIIKYLLSRTQAKHRIGFYSPVYEEFLDMLIKTSPNHSPVSEMLKYMKMIKNE